MRLIEFFLQAHQRHAGDAVEVTIHDAGLPITQVRIELSGGLIFGIGVHAQVGTAVFSGVVLVELDKGAAIPPPCLCRLHHQGVQHHDLPFRRIRITPLGVGVFGHLDLVDLSRCCYAVRLQYEQVTGVQGVLGGLTGGVNTSYPANGGTPGFFLGQDVVIDGGHGGDVRLDGFADVGHVLSLLPGSFVVMIPQKTRFGKAN